MNPPQPPPMHTIEKGAGARMNFPGSRSRPARGTLRTWIIGLATGLLFGFMIGYDEGVEAITEEIVRQVVDQVKGNLSRPRIVVPREYWDAAIQEDR